MVSRLGCFLSRLPVAPTRGYLLQSPRLISSSSALWNTNPGASKPAVTKSSSRGGLTGFLEEKTGVTGAWTLGVGVSAYLISKELYVINSETIIAVVFGGIGLYLMKKIGKPVADFLDEKSESVLELFNSEKNDRRAAVQNSIKAESEVESQMELRHDIVDILKENNAMRLEREYRRRLHEVDQAVKRKLDYQVDLEKVERQFQQEHMVQWLEKSVTELVKGKQEESLAQCVTDLKKIASA